MSQAYPVIDHTYDVVVVGAGGAGLRATIGMTAGGLITACLSKVFPTRSHTVAAQGGSLRRWPTPPTTPGTGICTTPSKAPTGSVTRMRSNTCVANAAEVVLKLEHYGLPFSRTDDGKIYQRACEALLERVRKYAERSDVWNFALQ